MLDCIIEFLLVHCRWVFVIYFLLPLSTLYDVFYNLRCKIIFKLFSNAKSHDKRVQEIQKQVMACLMSQTNNVIDFNRELDTYQDSVLARKTSGSTSLMCTARPGWQAMSFRNGLYKNYLNCIKINLMDILQIDAKKKIIKVEPLVTMGQITSVLSRMGWTLPVIPELDDLTVGGLIMGVGIETSSHKYGLFQHICEAYEIVVADGSVVRCSKDENADLFYAIPWSHGSLGFLVSADIRIVPATRYVRINYIPAHSCEEMIKIFSDESNNTQDNDFVEGLVYSNNTAVIMTAKMTDRCDYSKLNKIGKFHKPWFFTHAEEYLKKGQGVEYIPLRDYYHRHSRSLFWQIREIIPFGNNIIFRWLLGWMVPPKVSFLKLTQTKAITKFYERYEFIQDFLVPLKSLKKSIEFLDEKLKVYPLWLCPFILPNDPGMVHPPTKRQEMYVDVGIYGMPKISNYQPQNDTRAVEEYARSVNGFQMLYADTYQTREEFRNMFDLTLYNKVRRQYECDDAFPDVYDKVCKAIA